MRARIAAFLAGVLIVLGGYAWAAQTGGFPSRPRFQQVTTTLARSNAQASLQAASGTPSIRIDETDAGANGRLWETYVSGGEWVFTLLSDAGDAQSGYRVMSVARTGTTVDSINLSATSVRTNGYDVTASGGTFNVTPGGCTTAPSWTLQYRKSGAFVTVWSETDQTCTSNNAAFTIDTWPAQVRPSGDRRGWSACLDNGNLRPCAVYLSSSGTTQILREDISTGFTASGTKGLKAGFQMSYATSN